MERLKDAAILLLVFAALAEGIWLAARRGGDEAPPAGETGENTAPAVQADGEGGDPQPCGDAEDGAGAAEAESGGDSHQPIQQKETAEGDPTGREILEGHRVIAHALGPSRDWVGRNCLEGFDLAYDGGTRIFEADIRLTADGDLALRHDWGNSLVTGYAPGWVSTMDEFMSFDPILGKYTPLSFRDLLTLMDDHPDMLVITDTKLLEQEAASTQLTLMVNEAREMGLLYVFDRMYIQLYNTEMYDTARRVYDFPHYILTLYALGFDDTVEMFTGLADFCAEHGIEGITMWDYWWRPEYREILESRGLLGFVHTVNDVSEAKLLFSQGVAGIYTDILTEKKLEPAEEPEN